MRDTLAAVLLFLGSAAFVWRQNSRVAVLWDLGYLLDTSWRIALGQVPYRDFPLVHVPGTFLIQAGLIKLFGRHYIVPVAYAALAGGLSSVLAWRIVLRTVEGMKHGAWWTALILSVPLAVVSVYAIYPHPIYDGDCAVAILLAIWLLLRAESARGRLTPFCAGAACVLPVFLKQNMGLPFLAAVAACMVVLLLMAGRRAGAWFVPHPPFALVLAGMATALAAGLGILAGTAGLRNACYWTVTFAAQRRLPGFGLMLTVYAQPWLLWMVPALGAGLMLCGSHCVERAWAKFLAAALIAAPFAWCTIDFLLQDNPEDRADVLLTIWPLWLIAALVMAAFSLRRGVTLRRLMPFIVLAAIHGTFLSQQLWGSTYALWPLLFLLIAGVAAELATKARHVVLTLAALACITVSICGGLYAESLERLDYADIPDGPVQRAATPSLRSMATPGPYLANLDELIAFSDREIPYGDAIVLLPGEDPFYYATGRTPQFPVTLFDPATDPYSPSQLQEEARRRGVRWVIVKRVLQSKENVMPRFEESMRLMQDEFMLDRKLAGYDVYRRK